MKKLKSEEVPLSYQNPYLDPHVRGQAVPQAQESIQPRRLSLPRIILRIFVIIFGIALGLILFLALWFRQGQVQVPLVADYDARDKNISSSVPVSTSGHRVPLYVHGRYPIAKVPQKEMGIKNYLVFGIDSRGEDEVAARADTIMIVTVDSLRNEVRLSSILRDTQVNTEDYGAQKINAAYAYGGVGLLINTINNTFDLDLQEFVMLDFWTSIAIVDAVGGIEIDVAEGELEALRATIDEHNALVNTDKPSPYIETAGTHLMDGKQAIGWARIRATDSDIHRTGRQRHVMEKVLQKFMTLSAPAKLGFANQMIDEVAFNLKTTDVARLGLQALRTRSVKEQVIPDEGYYWTDTSTWNIVPNLDLLIPKVQEFIWP